MAQHFEVAVLGATPAAGLLAALVARQGRRVLWIDHNESLESYSDQGFVLPRKPELLLPLGDAPHARRIHERLGLTLAVRPEVPTVPLGMIDQRSRWALGGSIETIRDELVAEFAEHTELFASFLPRLIAASRQHDTTLATWPTLVSESLGARILWALKQRPYAALLRPLAQLGDQLQLGQLPPKHPLLRVLMGALPLVTHVHGALPRLALERMVTRLVQGGSLIASGPQGFYASVRQAAERAGVEVRTNTRLSGVGGDRKKLSQVFVAGERHEFGADYLVDGLSQGLHAAELLRGAAGSVAAPPAALGAHEVLNVVVRRRILPLPLGRHTLVAGRDDEPVLLVVRQALPDSPHDVLSVVFAATPPLTGEQRAVTAAALLRRLSGVVPFLEDGVETVSWPQVALAQTGFAHHPLYAPPATGIVGRSRRTPWRNVVRVGGDVVPTLGLEGSYMAAQGGLELLSRMAQWPA